MDKNNFYGFIDSNEIIWSKSFGSSPDVRIGRTDKWIMQLEADRDNALKRAEQYLEEQFLIDEGKLTPRKRPLSPEEKENMTVKTLNELMNELKSVKKELTELKEKKEVKNVVE